MSEVKEPRRRPSQKDYERKNRAGVRGLAPYRPGAAELLERAREKAKKWRTPVGARDKFSRNVMELVAVSGDTLKAMLASDEELMLDYFNALKQGAKVGDRTAMNILNRLFKTGMEEQAVVVTVLHQLGLSSMEELERLVQSHKDVEGVTPEQRAAVCMEYMELYLNANPGERAAAVRRLGGEVVVRSDSYAVVAADLPSGKFGGSQPEVGDGPGPGRSAGS